MGGRASGGARGKGAAGGGSGSTIPSQQSIDEIGDKMAEMARYAKPAFYDGVKAEQYYALQRQYNEMRSKRNQLLNAEAEKRVAAQRNSAPATPPKTFVNSFGEATTRNITSASYNGAQSKLAKDMMKFIGGKK